MVELLGEDHTASWRFSRLADASVIALHVQEGGFFLIGVVALAIAYDRLLAVSTALWLSDPVKCHGSADCPICRVDTSNVSFTRDQP